MDENNPLGLDFTTPINPLEALSGLGQNVRRTVSSGLQVINGAARQVPTFLTEVRESFTPEQQPEPTELDRKIGISPENLGRAENQASNIIASGVEAAGDLFGKAVSLSGDGTKLAIGANKNSGNGTYAGSVRIYNISASLPVDLIHFDVQTSNNLSSILHWATASEINNSHFEIERSYDAITFESVGEIAGNGNSQHLIEYSYLDKGISLLKNTVFYRLKQVDFDGAFEYSDIRVVRFDELGRGIHFSAYPNPTTNELSVTVSLSEGEAYRIEVTDLHGAKVHHENHTFTNGIHKLNTSEWNSGMYILQVATDKGSKYVKVMKE